VNLKCLVGIHKWAGDKCENCGKSREQRQGSSPVRAEKVADVVTGRSDYKRLRCSAAMEILLDASDSIVGLWLNDSLGGHQDTNSILRMGLADSRIPLHKDTLLAAYIDVTIENYRKIRNNGPQNGYYVMIAGHLAPGEKVPTARTLRWKKGAENPSVGKVTLVEDMSLLRYSCPTCTVPITVFQKDIKDEGLSVLCGVCGSFSHIYGDYRTWDGKAQIQQVYSSVYVPIKEYSDWYLSHPVFLSMQANHKSHYLNHYGLWGICPGCRQQYITTVLAAFATWQGADVSGVFMANSAASGRQMESLLKPGVCSQCGDKGLLTIMVSLPDSIEQRLQQHLSNPKA
jgi:hypothetical protein